MFAFILFAAFFLAESGIGKPVSGFTQFYNDYLNYPGFEVWKFINLAIFIALMSYLGRKPLGDAFRARRDQIRAELIHAEQEKQAAMAQLTSAEVKLSQLEAQKSAILDRAKEEAAIEKKRFADETKGEVERLLQHSEAELARIVTQARAQLRRFSAEESIRLAEEKLRARIDPAVDARLVKASLSEVGGLNQ